MDYLTKCKFVQNFGFANMFSSQNAHDLRDLVQVQLYLCVTRKALHARHANHLVVNPKLLKQAAQGIETPETIPETFSIKDILTSTIMAAQGPSQMNLAKGASTPIC